MVTIIYRSKALGGEGQKTRHRTYKSVVRRLAQLPARDGWAPVVRGTAAELEAAGAEQLHSGEWIMRGRLAKGGGMCDCEVTK